MGATITTTYRREHGEIEAVVAALSETLKAPDAVNHTFDIRALLNTLSNKVSSHLMHVDRVLYPQLLSHGDAGLRAEAERFYDELSGVAVVCDQYFAQWGDVPTISRRFPAFAAETRLVLARLRERLRREDEMLYPLVDRTLQ